MIWLKLNLLGLIVKFNGFLGVIVLYCLFVLMGYGDRFFKSNCWYCICLVIFVFFIGVVKCFNNLVWFDVEVELKGCFFWFCVKMFIVEVVVMVEVGKYVLVL